MLLCCPQALNSEVFPGEEQPYYDDNHTNWFSETAGSYDQSYLNYKFAFGVNGKDIFMASKVKKDPDTDIIKVRLTKDGTPFWTMTSQQLAKEMNDD